MHLQYVKVLSNSSAVLVVSDVSKSTESDFAVVEVFSAVASSPGALEECIAKEDVASMYVN